MSQPAFRFRLRTLLIVTTLLAAVLGIVGNVLVHIRRQTAIAAKIKEAGGSFHFDNIYKGIRSDASERDEWNRETFGEHTFRYIRHVHLISVQPRDAVLAVLPQLSRLEALVLSAEQHTQENLRHIAKCRNLQALLMHHRGMGGAANLSELRPLAKLNRLEIEGFDAASMREVISLPQLETLMLRSAHTNPALLAELKQLPKLRVLEIVGCQDLDHQTCAALVGLDQLEILVLRDIPLNAHDFQQLAKLPKLHRFNASKLPELNVESATELGRMSQLVRLTLYDSCTDEALATFAGLPNLETLYLSGPKITDASLPALKRFPNLKHLGINGTAITADGVIELARQPQLKHIQTHHRLTSDQEREVNMCVPGRAIMVTW